MVGPPTKRRRGNSPFGGKKLVSLSGAGSATTSSTSSTALMEASPTSRTDLYRLSYHLENLIDLWIVEVEIKTDISKTPPKLKSERAGWLPFLRSRWTAVENRKIRYEAIIEVLQDQMFTSVREDIVVNMGISGHTDHFIVPIYGDSETLLPAKFTIPFRPGSKLLKSTKEVAVYTSTGGPTLKQPLRCAISEGRRCGPDRLSDLY